MAIAKILKSDEDLESILTETKGISLEISEIRDLKERRKLFEYLKDDPENVEFEYVIKFYAYGRGSDGFKTYNNLIDELNIKELDYSIDFFPEWHVRKKKRFY